MVAVEQMYFDRLRSIFENQFEIQIKMVNLISVMEIVDSLWQQINEANLFNNKMKWKKKPVKKKSQDKAEEGVVVEEEEETNQK